MTTDAQIRLLITTIGGDQREIETPIDISANELIEELCIALRLPQTDAEGHRIKWRLDNRDTGQTLNGTLTLEAQGVEDGHRLSMIRPTTAGGSIAMAETFSGLQERSSKSTPNFLTKFLWWCSGAQVHLLQDLPPEHAKYQAIGAGVLADGLLGGLSVGYLFFIVFNGFTLAMLVGLVFGLISFNLTRFLSSSILTPVKDDHGFIPNFLSRFFTALPRLILSVFVGIVLSTPIVIGVFRNEINDKIYSTTRNDREQIIRSIAKSEGQITVLQRRIIEKQDEVQRLRDLFLNERIGNGNTGVPGHGPYYRSLEADLYRTQKELADLKSQTQGELDRAQIQLSEQKAEERILAEQVEARPDLLAQIKALEDLSKTNASIASTRWLLILMFLVLYCMPVLAKLLSPRGRYDELLDRYEHGSTEKESLEIQNVFAKALDRSKLNPQK